MERSGWESVEQVLDRQATLHWVFFKPLTSQSSTKYERSLHVRCKMASSLSPVDEKLIKG